MRQWMRVLGRMNCMPRAVAFGVVVALAMTWWSRPAIAQCVGPTNVTATSPCGFSTVVSWNPVNIPVVQYEVYRSTVAGQLGPLVATLTGTSWTDPAFPANITVYYTIRATWSIFCSTFSAQLAHTRFHTPADANISTSTTCAGVIVAWDPVPGASGYEVRRESEALPGFYTILGTTTATSFTDTTMRPGAALRHVVRAFNECGSSWAESALTFWDGFQAPTPGAPVVVGATCAGVTVQAPSAPFITGTMRIFRRVNDVDTLVGETGTLATIVDTNAPAGVSVAYVARMNHPCQISEAGPVSASVARPGPTPIAATISATDGTSCSEVNINFSFPPQPGLTSVQVLRATVNDINQATVIASRSAASGSGSVTDTGTAVDQTNWYWVRGTSACAAVLSPADTGWRGASITQVQFTQQPVAAAACPGETVTFSVETSRPVAAYRWQFNGVFIDPAVNPTAATPNLQVTVDATGAQAGEYRCRVATCAVRFSSPAMLTLRPACCDDIDFNNDGVFPEDQDVADYFDVLAGGECAACNDIDFNNNGVFPEDQDVIDFFNVLAGGTCP